MNALFHTSIFLLFLVMVMVLYKHCFSSDGYVIIWLTVSSCEINCSKIYILGWNEMKCMLASRPTLATGRHLATRFETTRSLNGAFIAPLSTALYRDCASHSHFTHQCQRKRLQHAHREKLGVQSIAQGHFDINSGGVWVRTGNLAVTLPVTLSQCRPK